MATTQVGRIVVATLNGAVSRGDLITSTDGLVTNATLKTTVAGDVLVMVGDGGVEQKFAAQAQTATAVAVKPLRTQVAAVGFASGSPLYMEATTSAL